MQVSYLARRHYRVVGFAQSRGQRAASAGTAAVVGDHCSLIATRLGMIVGIRLYLVGRAQGRRSRSDMGFAGKKQCKAQDRREPAPDDRACIGVPAKTHFFTQ